MWRWPKRQRRKRCGHPLQQRLRSAGSARCFAAEGPARALPSPAPHDGTTSAHCAQVLAALSPRERVILLDERGTEVSSEDVARIIAAAGDDGTPLAFCIGGPFGHGAAVVERADKSIRLSKCAWLVMPSLMDAGLAHAFTSAAWLGASLCAAHNGRVPTPHPRLVLNHSVALVVLLEQLYRG